MTTALRDAPVCLFGGEAAVGGPSGHGATLAERLEAVWHALNEGTAECPLCRSRMALEPGGRAGGCGTCGSRLG